MKGGLIPYKFETDFRVKHSKNILLIWLVRFVIALIENYHFGDFTDIKAGLRKVSFHNRLSLCTVLFDAIIIIQLCNGGQEQELHAPWKSWLAGTCATLIIQVLE